MTAVEKRNVEVFIDQLKVLEKVANDCLKGKYSFETFGIIAGYNIENLIILRRKPKNEYLEDGDYKEHLEV